MRARAHYTTEEKLNLLTKFYESGLTAEQFTAENNICLSTFGNWKRWYKNTRNSWQSAAVEEGEIKESQPEFKEINTKSDQINNQSKIIEIRRKSLVISCDMSILREVFDVLVNYD